MASAILARRNELHWAETKVYMRKPHPNSNPSLNKPGRFPNPNPNPKLASAAGDHATDYDEMPPSTATVSDYSSSINRTAAGPDHMLDFGGYVTFNISAYSKKELRDLKRRFESELEKVRAVINRIESRELQSSARSLGHSASGIYGGVGGREVTSSTGLHHPATIRAVGFLEKPAAQRAGPGQYYHQLPAVSTGKVKKALGGGRLVAPARGPKQLVAVPESDKALAGIMSKCRQILAKLMKNKGSIWFNKPVDVEGMKLHDYNTIIKNPMDLGTVRTKLIKGEYSSPLGFAGDVRLTFNNALIYNPSGHVVNVLAGQLLRLFDDDFCPAYEKFQKQQHGIEKAEVDRRRSTTWSPSPLHDNAMKATNVPAISPRHSAPPLAPNPLPVPSTVREKQQQQHLATAGRLVMGRLPKPKAKEPNKRLMSSEEKQQLSVGLQNLPQEKMDQVLHIVSKRNGGLVQHGNEIELDFQAMSTETLWELDRFVGNYKKMMSKIKRQEAMATNMISAPSASVPAEAGDKSPVAGEMPDEMTSKKIKKADPGDEDVDIGEEMPVNYPSVVIEKDNAGYASSSDSDSSSSSGSSGSNSDSSSGSDSDDDRQP